MTEEVAELQLLLLSLYRSSVVRFNLANNATVETLHGSVSPCRYPVVHHLQHRWALWSLFSRDLLCHVLYLVTNRKEKGSSLSLAPTRQNRRPRNSRGPMTPRNIFSRYRLISLLYSFFQSKRTVQPLPQPLLLPQPTTPETCLPTGFLAMKPVQYVSSSPHLLEWPVVSMLV